MECEALDHPNVVYITPTIGTVDGHTHAEVGIDTGGLEPPTPSDTLSPVAAHSSHGKSTTPGPGPQGSSPVSKRHWHAAEKPISNITAADGTLLPNRVTYPYARHSSLRELRSLVAALHPADVYQCVVDADSWGEHASVQKLFGDLCTGDVFSHDKELRSQSRLRYPSKNPESGGLKRSLSQEPETRLVGRDHEPESLLKKRRKVGAEKRSRTLGIVELLCEIGDDTLETVMVEEAVSAVLAGRWWGVELECTKRAWRYEPEVEL